MYYVLCSNMYIFTLCCVKTKQLNFAKNSTYFNFILQDQVLGLDVSYDDALLEPGVLEHDAFRPVFLGDKALGDVPEMDEALLVQVVLDQHLDFLAGRIGPHQLPHTVDPLKISSYNPVKIHC